MFRVYAHIVTEYIVNREMVLVVEGEVQAKAAVAGLTCLRDPVFLHPTDWAGRRESRDHGKSENFIPWIGHGPQNTQLRGRNSLFAEDVVFEPNLAKCSD